jgi:hypothetical protein
MNGKLFLASLGMVMLWLGLSMVWAAEQKAAPGVTITDKTKTVFTGIGKDPLQSPKPGCVPKTCEQLGVEVGDISDGCGKVVHCGIAQKVSVTIDPPQYAGVCPKTLRLTGTITAKKKGKAYYQWMGPTAPGNFQNLQNGNIVFESAGNKQVFLDYSVPVNLPVDQQRVHFWADGAEGVTALFKVTCTKIMKIGDGIPLDPKQ